MQNEFQNTNINVTKIEAKMASTGNMRYILTAQDGKKYFFYQKNKGVDCDVFKTFNNMEVKQGMTIGIGFVEEDKSFQNAKGETIHYTDRFISSIREAQGVPQAPITPKSAPGERLMQNLPIPTYHQTEVKPRNFKQEGFEKCLWGYWLETNARSGKILDQAEMDIVWDVFNQIETDARARFSTANQDIDIKDEPPLEEYPNF